MGKFTQCKFMTGEVEYIRIGNISYFKGKVYSFASYGESLGWGVGVDELLQGVGCSKSA